jgi:prevent-host-death family protein
MRKAGKQLGLFEAKTRVSAPVTRVQRGEQIIVTKHGVPVARLLPLENSVRSQAGQVAAKIRELRRGIGLGDISLRLMKAGFEPPGPGCFRNLLLFEDQTTPFE